VMTLTRSMDEVVPKLPSPVTRPQMVVACAAPQATSNVIIPRQILACFMGCTYHVVMSSPHKIRRARDSASSPLFGYAMSVMVLSAWMLFAPSDWPMSGLRMEFASNRLWGSEDTLWLQAIWVFLVTPCSTCYIIFRLARRAYGVERACAPHSRLEQ